MTDASADLARAVADTANGLFAQRVTQGLLEQAEGGAFARALWDEAAELGLAAAALPEELGGLGSLRAAGALLRPLGYHGVPLPLAEAVLGGWLAARAGLAVPQGVATLSPGTVALAGGRATGTLKNVPFGRFAETVVALGEEDGRLDVVLLPPGEQIERGTNLAGEPRDQLIYPGTPVIARAPLPLPFEQLKTAAAGLRAALMAGTLSRVLDLTVMYAKDRVQFGKPLGKFQAIQQQIAVLANHTAAGVMAAERAIASIEADDGPKMAAMAKIRVGEGASEGVRIAHQVHGAMGFTHEHTLHHFTRRLWAWRDENGSEAHWARWLGDQAIAGGADALWTLVGETV